MKRNSINNMTKKELLEKINKDRDTLKTLKEIELGVIYVLQTIERKKRKENEL